jgi:integrase
MRDFVTFRTVSNRWNDHDDSNLQMFDVYCRERFSDATELTQEMIDNWCRKRENEQNNTCNRRNHAVRCFVRYLRERGKTDVTEPVYLKKQKCKNIPHAFTETELQDFFRACDEIPEYSRYHSAKEWQIRRITVPIIFRLLYSSGIRGYEARKLRVKDVDLKNGVISICLSKGINQHYIALHDSMLNLMEKYDAEIDNIYPDRTYFFPSPDNSFLTKGWLCYNFRVAWYKYNKNRAVVYDFRHNYATENINNWTCEGFGFHDKLVNLSKSMGHSKIDDTSYYYNLVPGLADVIEQVSDDSVIPGVMY